MSQFLLALNYSEVLAFSVVIMASFCDLQAKKKTVIPLLLVFLGSLTAQGLISLIWGVDFCYKIYPLIAQLPFVLLFVYHFKKPWAFTLFSMFSSYIFTIPRMWTGLAANVLFGGGTNVYYITQIILTLPLLWVICKYVTPGFWFYGQLPRRDLYIIGLIPAIYYIFSYASTVYSDWLYSSGILAVELMVTFSICFYFCFTVFYINRIKREEQLKLKGELLNAQNSAARSQLEQISYSQQSTKALRHDMRHHMQIIDSYIESAQYNSARSYIHQLSDAIESTVITEFCRNKAANLIISSWDGKAKKLQVQLNVSALIPEECSIPELDICILLSNSIENAVNAAARVDTPEDRIVDLQCRAEEKKFYLLVSNVCKDAPVFSEGLPLAATSDHGIGTRSIAAVVQKYSGVYSFSVKDGSFILRIVI